MGTRQKLASFRLATHADTALLLKFMREFYEREELEFEPVAARAALEGLIDDSSNGSAWLVELEGRVVGYAVLTIGYSLEFHGADAFIDEISLCKIGVARASVNR